LSSPYIISYGAYLAELDIFICMEYTEKGSFDTIYKRIGAMKDIEKRRTPKELFMSFVFLFFARGLFLPRASSLVRVVSRAHCFSRVRRLSSLALYCLCSCSVDMVFLPSSLLSFFSRIDRLMIFFDSIRLGAWWKIWIWISKFSPAVVGQSPK
jgi:hypothetical protein